ncbi:hypothetical protein ACHAXA_000507 [Cyclostephanos tholiformis]|uniref:Uncharacterized protein n=1 Tax=Cyclostephanos tholiformis TaxID=382380 RepID=A0ABD3SSN8_9STRA
MDSAKDLERWYDYFNCRLMPHGAIILIPAILATLGLSASLADDGCDYARLRGSAVEMLTGSNIVPYVDVGTSGYRIPGYYPAENSWRVVYTDECMHYARSDLLEDASWITSEWLRFAGLVVGMTTSTFMWTATFLTLRPNHWRASGMGAIAACLCQVCSLVWFYTKLCRTTATSYGDYESGREVETSASSVDYQPCVPFFGSRCTIASCFLWASAAAFVLLREYPMPMPRLIAYDEKTHMVPPPYSTIPKQKQFSTGGGGGRLNVQTNNSGSTNMKSMNSTMQMSLSSSSYSSSRRPGSFAIVSGTPPPTADVPPDSTNARTSLRTSMRPAAQFDLPGGARPREFAGSKFSDVTFV